TGAERVAGGRRGGALAPAARHDPRADLPPGVRSPPERFRPVVRVAGAGREPAAAAPGGLSARRRPPGARYRRGDRAPPDAGRPRAPLHEYRVGRWVAPGRGGLPGVYLLAGRHLHAPRPRPGRTAALRAPASPPQRRGLVVGGVRSAGAAPGGQLPASPVAHRPGDHGAELIAEGGRPGRTAPAELSGRTCGRLP